MIGAGRGMSSAGYNGRQVTPEELHRLFYRTRFGRKLDRMGYVRFRHWRVYGEHGLAREHAAVWLYGGDTDDRVRGRAAGAVQGALPTGQGAPAGGRGAAAIRDTVPVAAVAAVGVERRGMAEGGAPSGLRAPRCPAGAGRTADTLRALRWDKARRRAV